MLQQHAATGCLNNLEKRMTLTDLGMQVAIACIKVASQAVSTMPSLFFFPIIPFIMTVCLIVYWVVVAGYLYSAGTITAKMTTASSSTELTISVSHHCPRVTLVLSLVRHALEWLITCLAYYPCLPQTALVAMCTMWRRLLLCLTTKLSKVCNRALQQSLSYATVHLSYMWSVYG